MLCKEVFQTVKVFSFPGEHQKLLKLETVFSCFIVCFPTYSLKKQKVFLFLCAFPAVGESSTVCLALPWNISSRHRSAAWPLRRGSEFHSYLVWDMWLLSRSAFQFYRIRVWNTSHLIFNSEKLHQTMLLTSLVVAVGRLCTQN